MKKYCIFLIALLLVSGVVAQSCLPEGIEFNNQAQIDSFQADYPACTTIEGLVYIYGDDITNLNGLNRVSFIEGDLYIYHNYALTSLTGLDNLTSIAGTLYISDNIALTSLTGLDNLTSIGGDIILESNYALTSLTGLNSLTSIGGGLCINTCTSLTSLIGLEGLTSIGGSLGVNCNNALTNLTGLDNLTSIGGNLQIGDDWYGGNPALTSLTGLDNLTSIGGDLQIGDDWYGGNPALTSLTGLDNVDAGSINDVYIRNNILLSSCDVQSICDYLASPNGNVEIYNNATGCTNQQEVETACELSCLPEGIAFTTQAQIDSFQADYPRCTEIEGNVEIDGADITNLNGLNVLTSIGGDLDISGNNILTSLTGLEGLTSIGDNLNISSNNILTSLTGLEGLNTIGGITIFYNDTLTSLTGLENLISITGDLSIIGNGSLSTCDAQWLCSCMANPYGSVDIHDNATGCNSVIDLAFACGEVPCLPYGNYYLTTQADIDNFQSAFPNCTELQGDLVLNGSDITNLNGLNTVTSIGCGLGIAGNDSLTTLAGLEELTSIGGDLIFFINASLTNMTGLEKLTSIQGHLFISYNPALTSLTGLDNLTYVGGTLVISGTELLNDLAGLNNLMSIGGGLNISANDSLTSMAGLENLSSIGGDLAIGGYAPGIADLSNPALYSLTGLENLSTIGGSVKISCNHMLTSLAALENIEANTISGLQIFYNPSLSTCAIQNICDYLAAPGGTVEIHNNATGCNSVIEVAYACGGASCLPFGDYYFTSQADIDNFQTVFPNCTVLQGNVTINGNDITNLLGLINVTSIEGSLFIDENDSLISLTGMEGLTSIGGHLSIWSNYALNFLTGMEGLTSIGGKLYISSNDALTSLTELDNLTSIGGYLLIGNNERLTSLSGLDNINAGSITDLYISYNTILSTCELQSICDYLASPNGTIEIWGNAVGCSSQNEVEAACNVGVDESAVGSRQSSVNLTPNPSSTTFTISMPTTPDKNTFITIYNINGQRLLKCQIIEQQTVVDVSGLKAGIYFVKVFSDYDMMIGKFVKQ